MTDCCSLKGPECPCWTGCWAERKGFDWHTVNRSRLWNMYKMLPVQTTIVSVFILVYVAEYRESTCLCDLYSAVRDKPLLITKDDNLPWISSVGNKHSAGILMSGAEVVFKLCKEQWSAWTTLSDVHRRKQNFREGSTFVLKLMLNISVCIKNSIFDWLDKIRTEHGQDHTYSWRHCF